MITAKTMLLWQRKDTNQICGSSTVKCDNSTSAAHCHCSFAVGILFYGSNPLASKFQSIYFATFTTNLHAESCTA
jgi:hypothetical protein